MGAASLVAPPSKLVRGRPVLVQNSACFPSGAGVACGQVIFHLAEAPESQASLPIRGRQWGSAPARQAPALPPDWPPRSETQAAPSLLSGDSPRLAQPPDR